MKTQTIKRHKKLPDFIKTHPIFTKFDEVKKVFPSIGLPNCYALVKDINYARDFAPALKKLLVSKFNQISGYSANYANRRAILATLRACKPSDFIQDGKINPVPKALADKHKVKDINMAWNVCHYGYDRTYRFYYPLDTKNLKVVFSSDQEKGIWDIATMSERGISSCQSWSGCYKHNLVGSIIDPCVGIIYLTDGKIGVRGERMLYRSVVRYVINKKTKKPGLFLENIYANRNYSGDEVMAIFGRWLSNKTGLTVFADGRNSVVTRQFNIPNSPIVKAMSECRVKRNAGDGFKDHDRSYRDSGITYTKIPSRKLKALMSHTL